MGIGSLVDVFSSGGLGAIVGAFGGIASKWQELKLKKLQLQEKLAMAKIRKDEVELEQSHELSMADKQMERAQNEGAIQADLKAGDAFIESIKDASKSTGIPIIDGIKGLMRPVITSFLLCTTIWLMWSIWDKVGGLDSLGETDLIDLFKTIVNQVVFLTVMAVSWYYAARPGRIGAK